jgi:hypothetical protein
MLQGKFTIVLPNKSTVFIIVVIIILLFQTTNVDKIFFHIYSRLSSIPNVIFSEDYTVSSVGKRLNSIETAFLYLETEGLTEDLAGEGYSNYEFWLENKFVDIYSSESIARTLQNIFAIIIISTGIIGLFLYIGFLSAVIYPCKKKIGIPFLVLWLAFHFATGHLIIYPLFGYLYLFAAKGIISQQDLAINDV